MHQIEEIPKPLNKTVMVKQEKLIEQFEEEKIAKPLSPKAKSPQSPKRKDEDEKDPKKRP